MAIKDNINKIRLGANMSQEQFAEFIGVSRQAVQKWESGTSVPELDKLVKISKYFAIPLDTLVLDREERFVEEMTYNKTVKPNYAKMDNRDIYASELQTEYQQCIEEGLDISLYAEIFNAVNRLPQDEVKKKLGDVLYSIVLNAKTVEGYKYIEPSTLDEIRALRKTYMELPQVDYSRLRDKITGAWMGRICGCLLGKTVEGCKTDELIPFLKETGNYPMHRYIFRSDLNDDIINRYKYQFASRCYADTSDGMPVDDDTNYVVLAQELIQKYGKDFTAYDVAKTWTDLQSVSAYWTAERVAYRNFLNGYEPPVSAVYKNPHREMIGAQIRGDYFGYINPGNPELAAEMAFRDASISHVKNGIYGEMFVAAMLAAAACTNDIESIIRCGLAQIPYTSRLYEAIIDVVSGFENGASQNECFADIHKRYDEYTGYGWVHTIPNAMIVVAALLYGKGNYSKSICMAVETGFDTDCNGATVGSILGMAYGMNCIDPSWTRPIHDTLHTSIFGVGTTKISERIDQTLMHIQQA